MTDWTSGYVAEINYTHGFYRELTPAILAFTAMAKGRRAPDLGRKLAYCELGCGQGFSANLLAAANPDIDFYATDFNPAQIAGAEALRDEAGIPNVRFSDASFQDYVDDPALPQFDFVALHGIYSWVSAENRKAIVDFIARKLKVGGLVYISYNALPGWAAAMPMRRLFTEHAGTTGGPLLSRIDKALLFADRLREAKAGFFAQTNGMDVRLKGVMGQNRNYLAHEYFNKDWTPLYFADVAEELGAAKLAYVASAHLIDHIDGANLTPEHIGLLNETPSDPVLRETVRDYLTQQQFRRDVFGRGSVEIPPGRLPVAWQALRLAASVPPDGFDYGLKGALGRVTLQEEVYKPLVEALSAGPRTVGQLCETPAIQALGWPRLMEAVKAMIGSGQVHPCLPAEGDAARAGSTRPFNRAVLQRALWSNDLGHLASPVTGGAVQVDRFQQLFLLARETKEADPAAFAWGKLAAQNQRLLRDGQPIQDPEDNLKELRDRYQTFEKSLPGLTALGVV